MNTASDKDKTIIGNYLGDILKMTMGSDSGAEKSLEDGKVGICEAPFMAVLNVAEKNDITEAWQYIQIKYTSLDDVNPNTAIANKKISPSVTREFSEDTYHTLVSTIASMEKNDLSTINTWKSFSNECWYTSMGLVDFEKSLSKYATVIQRIAENIG